MSLETRNITQGGQVIKYMISMFIQITNIVVYWCLWIAVASFFIYLFAVMKWVHIKHGMAYLFLKYKAKFLTQNPDQVFNFSWIDAHGVKTDFTRTYAQVMHDPYLIKCFELLKQNAYHAWGVSLIVFFVLVIGVFWFLGRKGRFQRKDEKIGGRALASSVRVVNQLLKSENKLSHLTIGDLHLVKNSEVQNIGLHGTVGTGKSTIIKSLLNQARLGGKRGIVYDKGNTFIPIFFRDGKDIILNPLDERCPNWDLWEECRDRVDLENFALPLLQDNKGNGDPFWILSARMLFITTAEAMRNDPDRSIRKLLNNLLSISLEDLRAFVANTDASNLVEGSIEKTAITIRTVLGSYARSLRICQGLDSRGRKKFSIREWLLNSDDDAWIFLSSDGRVHEAIKPILTAWISILMQNVLALKPDLKRRVWTILDELPSLQDLPNILEYLSEARKFGGASLIGIQNFPQLEQIYNKEKAKAIWDLLNTKAFFRSPSGDVAKWVQDEIGEIRHKKFKDQYSYGVDTIRDGVNFSKEELDENIVNYSDIQRLNDLECYVVLLGDLPVVKVKLKYIDYPEMAIGKIERDITTVFDSELDKLISETEMQSQVDSIVNKVVRGTTSGGTEAIEPKVPEFNADGSIDDTEKTEVKLEPQSIDVDNEQNGKVENNLKHRDNRMMLNECNIEI